ncbi:MAG: Crp/Fnr family transcriptional regulator [Crocinitomicaceae bacterium]|nr:Crp/Fnr family transcriptional regulator [Crocinitomicaceae bacterium]
MNTSILPKEYINVFEKELQEEIDRVGRVDVFSEGEQIMNIGNYIKSMPIVLEGSIKVLREDDDGNELFLYFIGPGETCAMSLTCCMQNQKSGIRTVAEEDVKLISIPVEYMDRWMFTYKTWMNFVMRTYSHRFEEMLNTIDLIAFHNMDDRLVEYLKEKSRIHKSNKLAITHQEIAFDLSSSREAISRLLKSLERKGKVQLHRNLVELL